MEQIMSHMNPPPLNWKFCATPKICKKLCCSSKIVDFTAIFLKISRCASKHISWFWNVAKYLRSFSCSPPLFRTLYPALNCYPIMDAYNFVMVWLLLHTTPRAGYSVQKGGASTKNCFNISRHFKVSLHVCSRSEKFLEKWP